MAIIASVLQAVDVFTRKAEKALIRLLENIDSKVCKVLNSLIRLL